jgi:hypothetical protein
VTCGTGENKKWSNSYLWDNSIEVSSRLANMLARRGLWMTKSFKGRFLEIETTCTRCQAGEQETTTTHLEQMCRHEEYADGKTQ